MDCNQGYNQNKYLRFIDNNLTVVKGKLTLLSSLSTSLQDWFQQIDSYSLQSVSLVAGATCTIPVDANFILCKVDWDSSVIIQDKKIEMILPEYGGVVGSIIPFIIPGTGATGTIVVPVKDIFMINSLSSFDYISFNNISPETCVVNVLTAKSIT